MNPTDGFNGAKVLRAVSLDDPSGETQRSLQRQSEYFAQMDRELSIAEDEENSSLMNQAGEPSGAITLRCGTAIADEYEVRELQLHDDEEGPIKEKRHRNNNFAIKIEAISYAKRYSVHSAAKKFNVDRKVIRNWKNNEREIEQQFNNINGSKRMRLDGGGRPVLYPNLDVQLADWIREMRENKREVSRSIIRHKAEQIFRGTDVTISNGWLEKFLKRHDSVLRRRTTVCQKLPVNYCEVIAKFIVHVEQRRKLEKFSSIYAMDETAVWFDCLDNRCFEKRGAKDVTVVTTGHEKMRVTVCLTARSDGKKLLPYVLLKRKRPVPAIVNQFKGKLIISWAGTTWMNDLLTEDYLRQVIKASGVFCEKHLLVWDAFASHKSERTLAVQKELGIELALIPGGCTKFIQAPDVCWNKPFKEKIRHYYIIWMSSGDRQEFTAAGNPKAPALEVVLEWVDRAWQEMSKEVIVNSFKVCGLTTSMDGSEDDKIACFRPNGPIGAKGLEVLRKVREKNWVGTVEKMTKRLASLMKTMSKVWKISMIMNC